MSTLAVSSDVIEASISAVVIRADGTREDLGVISYHHKNPLRMLLWHVRKMLHG